MAAGGRISRAERWAEGWARRSVVGVEERLGTTFLIWVGTTRSETKTARAMRTCHVGRGDVRT